MSFGKSDVFQIGKPALKEFIIGAINTLIDMNYDRLAMFRPMPRNLRRAVGFGMGV